MIITVQCPSCETSFPVDTDKVPEGGVNARCSVCSGIFPVDRPPPAGEGESPAYEPELGGKADPASGSLDETWAEAGPPAGGAEETRAESGTGTAADEDDGGGDTVTVEAEAEPDLDTEPAGPGAGAVPESVAAPAEPPTGFQFGKRDPHEKARRLARVLVSDMIMYNPERHGRALDRGTLEEDFEEEIQKSWDEYVEQVGEDVATGTSYFSDALNDILARGKGVFEGNPPR